MVIQIFCMMFIMIKFKGYKRIENTHGLWAAGVVSFLLCDLIL